ncbi:MAG: Clp protease [Candidatus Omnitrophica bacterium CG11_big_fil_rev_8_21_14_0_20_45_26]|uniref:D,D-heptose 1,7-bisphosphate phosphatase n=1 Tax=Candidatus Abzuiibacterium crystallinum TaxID=1974748 RepID=A0A2H0LQD7_9BACT|nr:MAG: Clp protease [Candidatus Omnitrophica bacterium CG11_big_fil_rev_8_21_14_0_20_45_26]PIW65777.1 MAG: Clp protease [Candidatus Omnitrophica bacterium CG12_big_fil_rev_8_21_14_0_65_45_16]
MDKVIFIDRDGVINVDLIGDYVKSWQEFKFEAGAVEALGQLEQAGFKIIVISNQAGVGEGIFPEKALWEVHEKMLKALTDAGVHIFASFYCLHAKNDPHCRCRKPKIGLFEQAAQKIGFDRSKTFFVGDKVTDIEAGKRFGLKTCFVRTGHGGQEEPLLTEALTPDLKADNLLKAVPSLVKSS